MGLDELIEKDADIKAVRYCKDCKENTLHRVQIWSDEEMKIETEICLVCNTEDIE